MGLLADLRSEVAGIFRESWDTKVGQAVPDPEDLKLANDGRTFERATFLYADLSESTLLVDKYKWTFAGEVYKAYLSCAARLVRSQAGDITSYDGDRIMAVFIGDMQSTRAATCGLQINWAVKNIINVKLKEAYPNCSYELRQAVGIATGPTGVARIGIRGGNDLVWIGTAANHAAKLAAWRVNYPTLITQATYEKLADDAKLGGNPKQNMWTQLNWNGAAVYGSGWGWAVT